MARTATLCSTAITIPHRRARWCGIVIAVEQSVAVLAIQCPIRPVQRRIVLEKIHQAFEPLTLGSWSDALNIGRIVVRSKFSDIYRSDVVCADVAPELAPDGGQTGKTCAAVEPVLLEEVGT